MPIIIISSDSYNTGRKIGEKTAKAAGYNYVDREILGPVAEKSNVREEKLIKALEMLQNKKDTCPPKKHGNIPL